MFNNEWIEKHVKVKKDRVIIKLHDYNGEFKNSVVIPTIYYPLCNNDFEVFTSANCTEISDPQVLAIIDKEQYQIGHCYSNSNNLCTLLKEAGYNAKIYTGWLFTGEHEYPAFHCWVVLNGNVIDLADDYTMMCVQDKGTWQGTGSKEHWAECMAEFYKRVEKENIPNHVRISPVGVPTNGLVYVGCESSTSHAVNLWNNLMEQYPNHLTKRHKGNKGTYTQQILSDIMEK